MDDFYRNLETSLLALGLALSLAAFAALALPGRPPAHLALSLPILTVTVPADASLDAPAMRP